MWEAPEVKFEKVEQFRPVTITLETKKEAQILGAALGRISGNGVDDGLIYKLYLELTNVADYGDAYQCHGEGRIEEL